MSGILQVFHPALPRAAAVARYLAELDASRSYTNRGALAERLEARLGALFGAPGAVTTAASGTAALTAAILAHAGRATPARPLALIPAFTFAATAIAAEQCGYSPHFVDISAETWVADPAELARHPRLAEVGLILPVAPFGRAPDMAALERLQVEAGRPVVLDVAAAFEAYAEGRARVSAKLPAILSLHATKVFSTGEGGAVLWADPAAQGRLRQVANFGFRGGRRSEVAGTNAKMSEYHAAVGLAMLDLWPRRRAEIARTLRRYRDGAPLPGRLWLGPEISSAYALLECRSGAEAAALRARLHAARIETRAWYEEGLPAQPWFGRYGADPLPVTEALAPRLLGLPMAHDLGPAPVRAALAAVPA
ncbi:DegT/DnrJ/EryC1/StrS family aminotransferase [Pseudoroseicyclus sp. CXY001]|uniref:DegT/DnrJ/EryC1/StrS family aminotransferase n=1 Tax=Pseudoroseicyclus sp. CXY001 TaxID=3242492 RepID=UPI0035717347